MPKRYFSDFKTINIPINRTALFSVMIYLWSLVGGPICVICGIVSLPVQYDFIRKFLSPVNCRLTRKKISRGFHLKMRFTIHFESILKKKLKIFDFFNFSSNKIIIFLFEIEFYVKNVFFRGIA